MIAEFNKEWEIQMRIIIIGTEDKLSSVYIIVKVDG